MAPPAGIAWLSFIIRMLQGTRGRLNANSRNFFPNVTLRQEFGAGVTVRHLANRCGDATHSRYFDSDQFIDHEQFLRPKLAATI